MKKTAFGGISRRAFLGGAALLGASLAGVEAAAKKMVARPMIETVRGPISPDQLGLTLAHEHVICDFVGAEKTGRHRWEVDAVVKRVLPYFQQIKERGVTGFVDCTPAFIGREPRALKKLSELTGIHVVTNTGYYGGAGDKFVPLHAYVESEDQLAERWTREWREGIEDTGIRPGFMKIGVDEAKNGQLSEIDARIVRAAARASRQTGMPAVCHTGGGPAGLAATNLFIAEGGKPERFIVAHSDGHGIQINLQVAERGAWVSFDGVGRGSLEQHLKLVPAMLEKHAGRLLLSMDSGWYSVGEQDGGNVRDYNALIDVFLPAFRKTGVSQAVVKKLTVDNPAAAFSIWRG